MNQNCQGIRNKYISFYGKEVCGMMKRIKDRFWYGCSCAYFLKEVMYLRFMSARLSQLPPPTVLENAEFFEGVAQVLEGCDCMLRRLVEEFITLIYGSTERFYQKMRWFKSLNE